MQAVIYILMLKKLIFSCMDLTMGLLADRVSRVVGRLGYVVLGVAVLFCVAFPLLLVPMQWRAFG